MQVVVVVVVKIAVVLEHLELEVLVVEALDYIMVDLVLEL